MANLGKKFLSAFVDIEDDKKTETETPSTKESSKQSGPAFTITSSSSALPANVTAADTAKFKEYFDKLFNEANMPGPDYYEYSKMLEAMQGVPDERVRFITAFAGLSVQGLDKTKLVSTAEQYIQLLDSDAKNFHSTVDAALQEKVVLKKKQMTEKEQRIQQLAQEITTLQNELLTMQAEVKDNEAKIEANTGGYKYESENMKNRITKDIEKIKTFIQ